MQQTQTTSVDALRQQAAIPREAGLPDIMPGFGSNQSFELMVRQSKLLMATTLVPASYREYTEKKKGSDVQYIKNENALANCCVALNMATRMGADPLMVMQNLYIVEGRPSWSSQWIIAAINGCGRFSPLRFDIQTIGKKKVEYTVTEWVQGPDGKNQKQNKKVAVEIEDKRCFAWVIEKGTNERLEGPAVSIEMAVSEGWYGKNGSKWQTMPDIMLRYRAASFFGKLYAPELLMGLQSAEEMHDAIDATPQADGSFAVSVDALRKAAEKAGADTSNHLTSYDEDIAAAKKPADIIDATIVTPTAQTMQGNPAAGEQMPGSIDMETGEIMEPVRSEPAQGPTLADATDAVKAGDFDLARDIARTLPEGQRKAVEVAIENAQPQAEPEKAAPAPRARRQRDMLNVD